jgi:hypothetical protein
MKKNTLGLVATLVVVLAVAVMVVTPASSKAAATPALTAAAAPAASPAPAPVPPHPEIQRAIDALQAARTHIHDAAHDFGGHREDALHAVDAALAQLRICMRYPD